MPFSFFQRKASPVERRRQELADQEALLARQLTELNEQLRSAANPTQKKPAPALWRERHEESFTRSNTDPELRRQSRRTLSAQRNRDRNRFLILAGVLLIIFLFVFYQCRSM